MITKKEMDNILVDVNRVLSNISNELVELKKEVETLKAKPASSKSTTK